MKALLLLLALGVGVALSATHLGFLVPVVAIVAVAILRRQVTVRNRVIVAQRQELDELKAGAEARAVAGEALLQEVHRRVQPRIIQAERFR